MSNNILYDAQIYVEILQDGVAPFVAARGIRKGACRDLVSRCWTISNWLYRNVRSGKLPDIYALRHVIETEIRYLPDGMAYIWSAEGSDDLFHRDEADPFPDLDENGQLFLRCSENNVLQYAFLPSKKYPIDFRGYDPVIPYVMDALQYISWNACQRYFTREECLVDKVNLLNACAVDAEYEYGPDIATLYVDSIALNMGVLSLEELNAMQHDFTSDDVNRVP